MSSAVPGPKVNYQGNSKLEKEAAAEPEQVEPKLKKIEGVSVIKTKKSVGKRIKESFGGQDLRTVGLSLLDDVVLPNTRDLLFDLIKEGAHRSIYGDNNARRTTTSSIASSIVGSSRIRTSNYNSMSASPLIGSGRSAGDTAISPREKSMFDFSNLVLEERDMAEEVIERMSDSIEEFGMVTVADFYDLIGVTGNGFTDQKFGWDAKRFSSVKLAKVREGWVLNLPAPVGIS